MYIPLPLRLTLLYTLALGLALWLFGFIVYSQAAYRAYHDLDSTLSTRAASVRLGKDLLIGASNNTGTLTPVLLAGVDASGKDGVNIEVLDKQLRLLATTANPSEVYSTHVEGIGPSPVPWDAQAAHYLLQHTPSQSTLYTTIIYQSQHIRVYTLLNPDFNLGHVIQTARSEQDIEQSLANLRLLFTGVAVCVMVLTLLGGYVMSRSVLAAVRHITSTAQLISAKKDFSKRVPATSMMQRDELATLAATFNHMLGSLEEAYQRQQRFVADASHELRAPITSIRCNLDLLAKAPDLPPEEVHAALMDARAEAERMGRLVSDLLQLARTDSEQSTGSHLKGYRNAEPVDLDSLLLEVFRQYRPVEENATRNEKITKPRLLLQNIVPVQVYGDADQLKQTLIALLDNALKYTPHEGLITLSLSADAGWAIVKVSDTGIGIFPADLPYIFDRFYRADRVRSRDRGSSGLGLAIVQSIVREHQGSIDVESTPGKGSTFTLRFPLVKD